MRAERPLEELSLLKRMTLVFSDTLVATYEEIPDPSAQLKSIKWVSWHYPQIGDCPVGLLQILPGTELADKNLMRFIEPAKDDEWYLNKGKLLIRAINAKKPQSYRNNRNDDRPYRRNRQTRSRSRSRSRSPKRRSQHSSTITPPNNHGHFNHGQPMNQCCHRSCCE